MTTGRPLAGTAVGLVADGRAHRVATDLLAALGASVTDDPPAGVLTGAPSDHPGLPAGTFEVAAGFLAAGAAVRAVTCGADVTVDRSRAVELVMMPHRLGDEEWATPPSPTPVGDGAIHFDLAPEDEDVWPRFVDSLDAAANDAEALAVQAQEWRLPVTPYRRRGTPFEHPIAFGDDRGEASSRPATAPLVVDFTTTWAGPVATLLLAEAGADVVRIEPDCRRDGLRDGCPAMFAALNDRKRTEPLDVRVDDDRRRLEELVAGCDLVVDTFSPRVMPNLGLRPADLRRLRPDVVTMSMPAFSSRSPEADWVSYGPGVHAVSGLGDAGGTFDAPIAAYPDPLAGMQGAVVALAMLLGRASGWAPRHAEIPLAAAVTGLLDG